MQLQIAAIIFPFDPSQGSFSLFLQLLSPSMHFYHARIKAGNQLSHPFIPSLHDLNVGIMCASINPSLASLFFEFVDPGNKSTNER